ncbi:MAG: ShlB/FhaC/HecB family hemolysin secretion/activation protein [Chlorobiaceae bacterium]
MPPPSEPHELPAPEKVKEAPIKADGGVHVTVKGFAFSGYEGVATEAQLQALVVLDKGRDLSFQELEAVADKVTAFLKENGWFLSRAYLPKQEVTSGIIEIAITPGRSDGNINITKSSRSRIRPSVLRGIGLHGIRSGQPINETQLERAVLLMNDLPGVQAKASLSPGKSPGTSGLDLAVTEDPRFSGMLWGDTQGGRYTGTWRTNAMLSLNDPFGYGDQATMLITDAHGMLQGRLGYNFPVTYTGLKGNLAYTGMHYELSGTSAVQQFGGRSSAIDAGLSYPVVRSRSTNLNTALSYSYKSLVDTHAAVETRNRAVQVLNISGSGDRFDQFLGGGYMSANVGITAGNLHESIANISLTGTEGAYSHYNLGFSRLQRVAERVNCNLSWSAQMASGNLDSSEKFSLGGPGAIHAYPGGEGAGDEGYLLNAEIRYSLPFPLSLGNMQLSGFYDAGHTKLNKNRYASDVTNATGSNEYWLFGTGLGLVYNYPGRLTLRGIWGHVIGDNPGRSVAGNDSDGTKDKNRYWLQTMLFF